MSSNSTPRWRTSMPFIVGRVTRPMSATVERLLFPPNPQPKILTMIDAVSLHLVVFVLATFFGALIAGLAGFAFGLIASAISLHILTPVGSSALRSGSLIVIQGFAIWKLRHALQIARLLPFVAGGIAGIPVGAVVLRAAAPNHLRASLGLLLVVFSVYSLARPKFYL